MRVLSRVMGQKRAISPPQGGRVLTVTSEKGGSGKTTLSVILAAYAVAAGDFKRVLGRLPMDDAIPTGRRWCEKSPFPQPESAALLESVLGVGRLWFEELDNGTRLRFTGATEAIASLRARLTSILPELNAGPD